MNHSSKSNSYYRVIALWALCEAMIGGIIHGLHIPVSGLIVGSGAVICISLIGWYHPSKGNILKATLVVAIFKMILSPQAPVTAYIAVFFQGLLGELLFWKRRYYILSCFVLAILALLESALQRILVLTILYGNDMWRAVNDLLNKLTGQQEWTNYSRWIIGAYIALHFLSALFVGWFCSLLPQKISQWKNNYSLDPGTLTDISIAPGNKKKSRKRSLFIAWVLLAVLYIQSYFRFGPPLLPGNLPLKIFLRSLIIVFGWIFIIGPFLRQLMHSWLKRKQGNLKEEVNRVLELLPLTEKLVVASWSKAATYSGWKRYREALKTILVNALGEEKGRLFILTAPIGSGKTTSVMKWIKTQGSVHGILSPVIQSQRYFLDIETKEEFKMGPEMSDTEIVEVGRFTFSKAAFEKAGLIIERAIARPGWLIIDEIGPLELRGEGLAQALLKVISERKEPTLLIVREGLAEKVKTFCQVQAIIVNNVTELPTR